MSSTAMIGQDIPYLPSPRSVHDESFGIFCSQQGFQDLEFLPRVRLYAGSVNLRVLLKPMRILELPKPSASPLYFNAASFHREI